jgi:hypothetical protein
MLSAPNNRTTQSSFIFSPFSRRHPCQVANLAGLTGNLRPRLFELATEESENYLGVTGMPTCHTR